MKLQTFNNKKGLIYGNDPKRIGCDIEGMDNSELPTYFMLSSNDTYKVSIKSVKVVQN